MTAFLAQLRSFLVPAIVVLLAICVGIASSLGGASAVLIFLAAVALCTAIALMWTSLERMGDQTALDFEDALSVAVPSATEEQKLAVLRALKDLEYELTVGKISREDFDQASTDYRNQARRLIAAQDESMQAQLEKAEQRVQAFLQDLPSEAAVPEASARPASPSKTSSNSPAPAAISADAAD